jgi:hypothetical protein
MVSLNSETFYQTDRWMDGWPRRWRQGAGKNLWDHGNMLAKRVHLDALHVLAVHGDPACLGIIQTIDELQHSRFATAALIRACATKRRDTASPPATRGSNQGNCRSSRNPKAESVQHFHVLVVAEINLVCERGILLFRRPSPQSTTAALPNSMAPPANL